MKSLLTALALGSFALAQNPCTPAWSAGTFAPNGVDGTIFAMKAFDDGSGPALFVGGSFSIAGSAVASNIAKWNGTSWSPVGAGMNGTVWALAVFDDGGGPALYAGGSFTTAGGFAANRIAKWNGATWSAVGTGTNGDVRVLTAFGAALFVGGAFTIAGGLPASNVATWTGVGGWGAIGNGLAGSSSGSVNALAVFNDGSGLALFAGASFTPPPPNLNNIYKWNGTSWAPVGLGITGGPFGVATVSSLAVHDDGSGPALYVGGNFTVAGGVAANRIARWNGTTFSPLGSGLNGPVFSLLTHDDGNGPALFATGAFSTAGSASGTAVAKWQGAAWSPVGSGLSGGSTYAMAAFDPGVGFALFAGGVFDTANGIQAAGIAKWDGLSWSALGTDFSLSGTVNALAAFDDGNGARLYAAGQIYTGGTPGALYIARREPTGWQPLNGTLNGPILSLAAFNDGSGPALYVGGFFSQVAGVPISGVARWNGTAWSPVGGGVNLTVTTLVVHDDGTGPALYAGGFFVVAGGVSASCVAKWNGSVWSPLGLGTNDIVEGLCVFNDGTGPALYATGAFTTAGGAPANRVAKWSNGAWSALGSGLNGTGYALAVHDDGFGPSLYVGGLFTTAGGIAANRIARWNGTSWSSLGSGVDDRVVALRSFDDGSGPGLFAGGLFTLAGGASAAQLAKWQNGSWSSPGGGISGGTSLSVQDLIVFDDGSGAALHAGGKFSIVAGVASQSVGKRSQTGPPLIQTTLVPQIIYPGGPTSFSIAASGTQPFQHQWLKNGNPIPGANGPTLQVLSAAASDAATYSVMVSNACGSSTSVGAGLTIVPGLQTYGTGTRGCAGLPWIGASGVPQIGQAGFAVFCAGAPPSGAGYLVLSGAALSSPLSGFGLSIWIDLGYPVVIVLPISSDAGGGCVIPAPLPNDPGLVGILVYVQTAWQDACASGGLSATNAIGIGILP